MKYCGREFSGCELDFIRNTASEPGITRRELSRQICKKFGWLKPDGGLKDMSCRVALLRMAKDGVVQLQPVKPRGNNFQPIEKTPATDPKPLILRSAGQLQNIRLELVTTKNSRLWNEYIDRYHYLGHKTLPGAQLRYFAHSEEGLLALFGFGAAAWAVAPRDDFIGWYSHREANLHLVVNNARFLILPWVQSQHLASKLLGLVVRRLANDWQNRYGYRPVLLETFVEKDRFAGTCYRAANWTYLGETQGRGKLDRTNAKALPIKTIWVLPLEKHFREVLNNLPGKNE
jgi:uncharacterized protein DUF4338